MIDRFSKCKPDSFLSKIDFINFHNSIIMETEKLYNSRQAIDISELFKHHEDIEDTLRKTQILGFPLNALLAFGSFCSGLCYHTTRLFALASGIENIVVATAVDSSVSVDSKTVLTENNWKEFLHSWVEFSVDGEEIVIDFSQGLALKKEDFYRIKKFDPAHVQYSGKEALVLQDFTTNSVVHFAVMLENFCYGRSESLLDMYDQVIEMANNSDEDNGYVINELNQARFKLLRFYPMHNFVPPALILSQIVDSNGKYKTLDFGTLEETMVQLYNEYAKKINPRAVDPHSIKKILDSVFPETRNLEVLLNETYHGPRESYKSTEQSLMS